MSETVLKIRIGEFGTVRVICQNAKCGTITEFLLTRQLKIDACPVCHEPFSDVLNRPGTNPLANLLNAMREFEQLKPPVDVEFVILVKS